MLKETYYGESIINNIMTVNDFSDTTRWEIFKPTDLDGPPPYMENGVLIQPLNDWTKQQWEKYANERKEVARQYCHNQYLAKARRERNLQEPFDFWKPRDMARKTHHSISRNK